jgi:hypothetical protein
MKDRPFIKLSFEDDSRNEITHPNLLERYGREALCYCAVTCSHWECRRWCHDIEDDPRPGPIPDFGMQNRIRGTLEQDSFSSLHMIAEAMPHALSTIPCVLLEILHLKLRHWRRVADSVQRWRKGEAGSGGETPENPPAKVEIVLDTGRVVDSLAQPPLRILARH